MRQLREKEAFFPHASYYEYAFMHKVVWICIELILNFRKVFSIKK